MAAVELPRERSLSAAMKYFDLSIKESVVPLGLLQQSDDILLDYIRRFGNAGISVGYLLLSTRHAGNTLN